MCYTEHSFNYTLDKNEIEELFKEYNIDLEEYLKISNEVFKKAHKYTTS